MSDTPDYATLVKLLPTLRNLVDACGEVTLTAEEAAQIRSLGFPAEAGHWEVPPVPFELVCDNPLLENLSIGWKPAQAEATPNRVNAKNQLGHTAQIIEGKGQSGLSATKADGIRQSIDICKQQASEHTANREDGAFPKRRRAGHQLPRTLLEQDGMAEEAASRVVRTLSKAYKEGKRMTVRDLQQRHWRFPASVFHQALRFLERTGRILY